MGMQIGPVNSLISVDPQYDFELARTMVNRQDLRVKEGSLYTYVEAGRFTQIKMPLTWVTSADRLLVNSWWETATDIRFVQDSAAPSSFMVVRIMGLEESFQSYTPPYEFVFYSGEIILETI